MQEQKHVTFKFIQCLLSFTLYIMIIIFKIDLNSRPFGVERETISTLLSFLRLIAPTLVDLVENHQGC